MDGHTRLGLVENEWTSVVDAFLTLPCRHVRRFQKVSILEGQAGVIDDVPTVAKCLGIGRQK